MNTCETLTLTMSKRKLPEPPPDAPAPALPPKLRNLEQLACQHDLPLGVAHPASLHGRGSPLISVFFAVVRVVECDLVDAGRVGLRGGLLVVAGGHLLVRLAFAERDAHLGLLRLGAGQELVLLSQRVL